MTQHSVKDLFSRQSEKYALSRPTYPTELFDFIFSKLERRRLAWDCATGNGQAAAALAPDFVQVIASDISQRQLAQSIRKNNIDYQIFPAEGAPLRDKSVDLITVAQAVHWFDFDAFYTEAHRVLRGDKKGVIAVWAYGLHSISQEVDKVTQHLYEDMLGSYWPPERKYIEERYESIPFPFEEIKAPQLRINLQWNVGELVNYFSSWSSVQKFIESKGHDPVAEIRDFLEEAWGNDVSEKKEVTWPLYVRMGRSK